MRQFLVPVMIHGWSTYLKVNFCRALVPQNFSRWTLVVTCDLCMFYLLCIGLSSGINYCLVVNQVIGNPLSIEATNNHACIYRTLYFGN